MEYNSQPRILSSCKSFLWTLPDELPDDSFEFAKVGSAALLLVGMHLKDPKPWIAARNPVFLPGAEGFIDSETKRILGKRYRPMNPQDLPVVAIDPFAEVLSRTKAVGHDFSSATISFPERVKVPGKLLARELIATAEARVAGRTHRFYARNFAEISQCLHAELSLLLAMSASGLELPMEMFRLETSLKPCRMCAAFLHSLKSKTEEFHISFENDDPGPLARNTMLDQFGYSVMPK